MKRECFSDVSDHAECVSECSALCCVTLLVGDLHPTSASQLHVRH